MVKRHKWVPTGFSASTTGGGVSGALIISDAQHCQNVVAFVDDRRFMSAGPRDEISSHVLESVQAVRAYAVNAQFLPGSKMAQASIKEIARACRDYVSSAKPGTDQQILEVALLALRKRIGVQLLALVEKYDLDCDLDLTEFRADGVEILEGWMRQEPYEVA